MPAVGLAGQRVIVARHPSPLRCVKTIWFPNALRRGKEPFRFNDGGNAIRGGFRNAYPVNRGNTHTQGRRNIPPALTSGPAVNHLSTVKDHGRSTNLTALT